jgi:hypothetical protein
MGLESRLQKLEAHRSEGMRVVLAKPLSGESEEIAIERMTREFKTENGLNALIVVLSSADANT